MVDYHLSCRMSTKSQARLSVYVAVEIVYIELWIAPYEVVVAVDWQHRIGSLRLAHHNHLTTSTKQGKKTPQALGV